MAVEIAKRSFNVAEYYRMAEAGILKEDDRVELINGEIIEMSPAGSRHAGCVKRLNHILVKRIGHLAVISVQDPVDLDEYTEPEPDVALLRPREDFYSNGHPTPRDVLLVIEVADSLEGYDHEIKAPLYARAGIPETWVASLLTNIIHQYAQPANGRYQMHNEFKRGESTTSVALPELTLTVDEILG
jgi:Uma2 family endonuclease